MMAALPITTTAPLPMLDAAFTTFVSRLFAEVATAAGAAVDPAKFPMLVWMASYFGYGVPNRFWTKPVNGAASLITI